MIQKPEIKEKVLSIIKDFINPIPIHYEWKDDGCPYDISGYIYQDGHISLNQTISHFLEEEYCGSRRATYESGMGFYHETYSDLLEIELCTIVFTIICDGIKSLFLRSLIDNTENDDMVEFVDKYNMSKDVFDKILDEIFEECGVELIDNIENEFFPLEGSEDMIKYLGIGDIKLYELVEEEESCQKKKITRKRKKKLK